jgi:hypothetical protein
MSFVAEDSVDRGTKSLLKSISTEEEEPKVVAMAATNIDNSCG